VGVQVLRALVTATDDAVRSHPPKSLISFREGFHIVSRIFYFEMVKSDLRNDLKNGFQSGCQKCQPHDIRQKAATDPIGVFHYLRGSFCATA